MFLLGKANVFWRFVAVTNSRICAVKGVPSIKNCLKFFGGFVGVFLCVWLVFLLLLLSVLFYLLFAGKV